MKTITQADLLSRQLSYKSPKGYAPWDEYISNLASGVTVTLIQLAKEAGNKSDMAISPDDPKEVMHLKSAYAHLMQVLYMRAPALFLSRELLHALSETTVPPLPESMELPLAGFHLLLPDDYLLPGKCGLAVHLAKNVPTSPGYMPQELFPDGCIMVHIGLSVLDKYVAFSAFLTLDGSRFFITPDFANDYWGFSSKEVIEAWKTIQTTAVEMVIQTILILLFQSHLVSEEDPAQPSGIGFRPSTKPPAYLPTRWLGKDYRRQSKPNTLTGLHASPRAHWRKGHWHHFRYGQGRKQLKLKWIEPIFVNP